MKFRLTFLLLLLGISHVKADLPVHCMKSQIIGDWTLELTEPITNHENEMVPCGHEQPDRETTSNMAMLDSFESSSSLDINLKQDDSVYGKIDGGEKYGQWTMIYDEGFEITYSSYKFFAFSKYDASGFNYESVCDQTLIGWYNNINTGEKGCYRAYKPGSSGQKTQNVHQDKVVQPHEDQLNNRQQEQQQQDNTQQQQNSQIQLIDNDGKKIQDTEPMFDNESPLIFTQTKSFLGENKLDLKKDFNNHQEIVDKLNSLQNTWTAKVPDEFKDLNLSQMNSRAGRIRKQGKFSPIDEQEKAEQLEKQKDGIQKEMHKQKHKHHLKKNAGKNNIGSSFIQMKSYTNNEDIGDLPSEYDWEQYLQHPISQGDCGSCYAIATSEMLSVRLNIKYGEDVQLSAQHSLDCNYYNQGCEGGYGFLVSKFGSEYEMVTEECHPYKARDGKCSDSCDVSKQAKTYKVKDYRYIGGAYGKSTEKAMMEEIYENGPIVVSFEPNYDFMYYSEGIYQSSESNAFVQMHQSRPEWEKVDHSVLCYGWGEENGVKYWKVLNSWGKNWGEKGTFRIRRGIDESHIESMGEAATPYIVTH